VSRVSRRQFVVSAGAFSTGLLAGCGRLPWQVQAPVARIGHLVAGPSNDPSALAGREAFQSGLREFGYVDGQNIIIEWRSTEGQMDRLAEAADELARLPVDILVAAGPPVISAARRATSTIPIVMVSGDDPVGLGFVASLARPGGTITGLSNMATRLSGKQLELLKVTAPGGSRVAVLWDAAQPGHLLALREFEAAARVLAVQVQSLELREPSDFAAAFERALGQGTDALVVLQSGLTLAYGAQIREFAAQNRLPAMYSFRHWVEAGGLMSYATSAPTLHRRAAYYVDRILKGTKPADLPIEQPMTFDFVVNLKTAAALGITFPREIMLQVTEVIQ
jgi:putative tryptophan/tyrosine transport system substrate-binding protein